MRRVRYSVAMSLDGFIAGPDGEYDWIVVDPTVDFTALSKEFDTLLMGRRTFELALRGPGPTMPGMQTVVCSHTLGNTPYPGILVCTDAAATVSALKTKPGKDIWLFGGAGLFRSLLDSGLVDTIEVSVTPILLSQGVALLPAGKCSPRLRLLETKSTPSGTLRLSYAVDYVAGAPKS
jgi:dihydrofolate reductase